MVETGTATAPARKQPRMAASMGSPSDIISSTRSSDRTPASRKEAATTPQSSSSSAYVVVSAARTATLSPRPSSTLRVTRYVCALKRSVMSHPLVVVGAALARAVTP